MSTGIASVLWFIAIIAMIPAALWLLKRTPMGGTAVQGTMKSIAVLPLSPSQRLVTVEVGSGADRQWLVLGVTAQTITTLHAMPPQQAGTDDAAPAAAAPSFQNMLRTLRAGLKDRREP
jgi:flagellar protein FliO/FliZ